MTQRIKNPKRPVPHAAPQGAPDRSETGSVLHGRFDDIDALCETTRAWDLDFARIDRTPFDAQITQIDLGSLRYDRASFEAPIEQHGSPPPDCWTIAIPGTHDPRMVWRGRELKPGMVPVYRPGSEIDVVSRSGFSVMPIAIRPDALARLCEREDLPAFERRVARADVLELDPAALTRLRRALHMILDAVATDPSLLRIGAFRHNLTRTLPATLLHTLNGSVPTRTNPTPRNTLERCLEVISMSEPGELTVSALAGEASVSERAVQQAFARGLRITPKAMLKARALNAVRRRLLDAPLRRGVNAIAAECGFWHAGQFAADYRRMFGELPSQTLARRPLRTPMTEPAASSRT